MTKLHDLLAGLKTPGVYRFTSLQGPQAFGQAAEARGWRFFYLPGDHIASKEALLTACAHSMRFPGYFGGNWDALQDSLRDLSWAPAQRGYLVLWDQPEILAAAQPEAFAVALDVFRKAVGFWRTTDTPMAVLLRGAIPRTGGVPRL